MKLHSVTYFEFFKRKFLLHLLNWSELSISSRKDFFFASHNDRIGGVIQVYGNYEREYLSCLEMLVKRLGITDKLALDVGANIGNHTLYFSRIFDTVIAFEPSQALNLVLRANIVRNGRKNVEVFCCGLGEEQGTAFVKNINEQNTGMVELEGINAGGAHRENTVDVCKADDLILGRKRPIGFVKVDVEGMEVAVLKGMRECLIRDKPLIGFESRNAEEGDAVVECLSNSGYSYFYEIKASRVFQWNNINLKDLLSLKKSYSLRKIANIENRFYPIIFASAEKIII